MHDAKYYMEVVRKHLTYDGLTLADLLESISTKSGISVKYIKKGVKVALCKLVQSKLVMHDGHKYMLNDICGHCFNTIIKHCKIIGHQRKVRRRLYKQRLQKLRENLCTKATQTENFEDVTGGVVVFVENISNNNNDVIITETSTEIMEAQADVDTENNGMETLTTDDVPTTSAIVADLLSNNIIAADAEQILVEHTNNNMQTVENDIELAAVAADSAVVAVSSNDNITEHSYTTTENNADNDTEHDTEIDTLSSESRIYNYFA